MPNYQVQFRRGTSAQHSSFTGAVGEITVDTTKTTAVVHDGSTAAGRPLAREDLNNVSASDVLSKIAGGTVPAGNMTITGHLLPSANVTHDLGSSTLMWRDVYVGPGSLYINNKKVIEDDSGTITVTTSTDSDLKFITSGLGDIEIATSESGGNRGAIKLTGNVQLSNSFKITDPGGTAVQFGSNLDMNNNKITELATPTAGTDAATKAYVDQASFTDISASGDVTISGDLTVSGTTTTINTETIALADNIIEINSNFTSGNPTEDAGIKVSRGDQPDVQLKWNETDDKWTVTEDGSNYYSIINANDATSANTANKIVQRDSSGDFAANIITATATSARYADLAEIYGADEAIEPGTVVMLAGEGKVKPCDEGGSTKVAGVVSTAPAYLMNNEADGVAVALAGRVPVKMVGGVKAGDLLESAGEGAARLAKEPKPGAIIGKALHDADEDGVVEMLAIMM